MRIKRGKYSHKVLVGYAKAKHTSHALIAVVFILSIVVPSLFWPQPASAAISVEGTPTTNITNSGTSIALTTPGNTEGDMLIVVIAISSNATITAPAAPGGTNAWTRISPNGATTCNNATAPTTSIQVWRRQLVASDTTTNFSFTWTGAAYAAGGMVAYRGVNGASPIDNATLGACGTANGTTSLSAAAITTASANARVIAVYGMDTTNGNANTINTPTGMTSRVSTASSASCGFLCNTNQATVNLSDVVQATAGTTGAKATTSTQSGNYAAYLFSLKPAATPTYSMSGYRWFDNIDSSDLIGITNNVTAGDDKVNATAVDPTGGYVYLAGHDSGGASSTPRWRIEKRRISDGSLVLQFNNTGILTEDVGSSVDEKINAMAIDVSGGYMYLAGYDSAGSSSSKQWRIEKRNLSDGSLVTAFGNTGCASNVGGVLCSEPGTLADYVNTIAIDTNGGAMYVGGNDGGNSNQWRIEKRNLSDGSLVTAFNSTGVIVANYDSSSGKNEEVASIVLDISGGNMYVGGNDASASGANNTSWRVEKRSMSTGAFATTFGNHDSGNCKAATSGSTTVYCVDPNSGGGSTDQVSAMALDSTYLFIAGYNSNAANNTWRVDRITLSSNTISASLVSQDVAGSADEAIMAVYSDGTNIYLAGYDTAGASSSQEWRYEKRTVAGALVSAFGTGGIVTSDPTNGADEPANQGMSVDTSGGYLYTGGFDSTGSNQWRLEKRNLTTGSGTFTPTAQADLNTAYSATPQQIVRLRLLMHIGFADFWPSAGQQFKLQVAPKSGTCDTAYSGETFTNLSAASGAVRYFDNPGITDGANTVAFTGNDPTHGSDTIKLQTFEEANNFTNSAGIVSGSDGLWDFAIADNDLPLSAFGAYCFRVVDSADGAIATPVQVPELNYCGRPPTSARLRNFKYFCDEKQKPFYWLVP